MKLENLNGFSRVTPMDGRTYGQMSASPTTGTCREYGSGEVVTNAPLPCPKGFEQLEGYSRVNYLNGYDDDEIMDGFMLSGFVLNGYMLSGHEVDDMIDYCEWCDQAGEDPTMDGLRDRLRAGRARRQARRKAKKNDATAPNTRRKTQRDKRHSTFSKTGKKAYKNGANEIR